MIKFTYVELASDFSFDKRYTDRAVLVKNVLVLFCLLLFVVVVGFREEGVWCGE